MHSLKWIKLLNIKCFPCLLSIALKKIYWLRCLLCPLKVIFARLTSGEKLNCRFQRWPKSKQDYQKIFDSETDSIEKFLIKLTWFSQAASLAIQLWCSNKFREATHGEFDDAFEVRWCDSFAAPEPKRECQNTYETIYESKWRELILLLIQCDSDLCLTAKYLICDSDKDRTEKKISTEGIFNLYLSSWTAVENPSQLSKNR